MDPRLQSLNEGAENKMFSVLFFPDRIYHAAVLNATRSPRYRYDVQEVRGYHEVQCLKGQVFLDGMTCANFLRIEYRGSRLTEAMRSQRMPRLLRDRCLAWVRLTTAAGDVRATSANRLLVLHWDDWVNAYQAEVWDTLAPPGAAPHALSVLSLIGRDNEITRIPEFDPLLGDVRSIKKVELSFREPWRQYAAGALPPGDQIAWDNNYARRHQALINPAPSSNDNTIDDLNYMLDFQRGWYQHAKDVQPVLYRNAMMLADDNGNYTNPLARADNIISMRWLFQRELGGSMIFFHEVTIPPGKVEGNHQHIGSEELYYIIQGKGTAFLRVGDDPKVDAANPAFPDEQREVFGLGVQTFKALPVTVGDMIFTKSGGMHGIENPAGNAEDLKFVAFLYHSA